MAATQVLNTLWLPHNGVNVYIVASNCLLFVCFDKVNYLFRTNS